MLFGIYFGSLAQTTGLPLVISIESKALSYKKNETRMAQLKAALPDLERQWMQKKVAIESQITNLIKERDALIADMKAGAKCSQCGQWKSQMEKAGENFEQHLGEVKGYAIPASTSELEVVRKQYAEKIAIQKVQLQRLQKGDEAILANKKELEDLTNINVLLCQDITKLSKDYETTVLQEAKRKQEEYAQKLVNIGSDILIFTDWITIYRSRVGRYDKNFQVQCEEIRQRLEVENKEFKEAKNTEIILNNNFLISKQYQEDSISSLVRNGVDKNRNEQALESIRNEIINLNNKNQSLVNEILYSDAGLNQKIQKEIAEKRTLLDKETAECQKLVNGAESNLALVKLRFNDEVNGYSKANGLMTSTIIEETNRMVIAAQSIECPVWNNTSSQVASDWNQLLPCLRNLVSSTTINPYCSKWNLKKYLGKYISFLSDLDSDDRSSIQTNLLE